MMLRLKYQILIILILLALVASEEVYCKNGAVTQSEVNILLSYINDKRTKLAKGLQSNGEYDESVLPPAKNMKKMAYDCALEHEAKLFLDSVVHCDKALSKRSDKGYFYGINSAGEGLLFLLSYHLQRIDISNGFFYFETNQPVKYTTDDDFLFNYANLMRANVSRIGCTVRTCPDGEHSQYLCLIDQKNIQNGEHIYEMGTGNCDCDAPMTCEESLCVADTAQFPGSSTAEPSTKCTSQEISDTMRMHMQDTHNYRRSLLALGQVVNNKGNTLPPASNINYLIWNCALEREAHDFVRSCPLKGYQRPDDEQPAQNFYRAPIAGLSTYRDLNKKTITEWWKQIRKVEGLGANNKFRSKHESTAIKSYTLMGWASTREMGCSIAICGEDYVEACRYYPPGNKLDAKMYEIGSPCSGCSKLEPCDASLGLCGSKK